MENKKATIVEGLGFRDVEGSDVHILHDFGFTALCSWALGLDFGFRGSGCGFVVGLLV